MKRSLGRHWGRSSVGLRLAAAGRRGPWRKRPSNIGKPRPTRPIIRRITSHRPPRPVLPRPAIRLPLPPRRANIRIRSSPINLSALRNIQRSSAAGRPSQASRSTGRNPPPDNRATYPQQDPRAQGVAGPRPTGLQVRRSKVRPCGPHAPQAPFVLSPPEASGPGELAHGLGKAEQRDPCPGVEVLSLEIRRRVRQRQSAAARKRRS